ncbi:hypothetical protein ADK57_30965 [Streptomyces sp. MMG1533]|uniref:DUF6177 family protein n=1 Tax=Streptomyces sp. MMG1533 TaxID=1415546 RepID=UPI0006AE1E9E|nr:DUF6177 family protein [Streptomyces sp. MMG1533]KOU60387.1 hypothetical protein ADK57_30965 [Streptomyces sp. MMG1533]
MPDVRTVLAGLYAGGPEVRVARSADESRIQLQGEAGQTLVSFEAPLFVQVQGEVERLLGPGVGVDAPVWWTEIHSNTAYETAGQLAGSIGARLTAVLGGAVWPPAVSGETDVVETPPGETAPHTPAGVDILTDRAVVVIQDRPVVAATASLTEIMRTAAEAERELQIVTPPATRLTLPTRTLLGRLRSRWVVRDSERGYHDGLTGAALHWKDGHFAPPAENPQTADAFKPQPGTAGQRQLILAIRTIHSAGEHLLLGGALETAWQALTGNPPAGWSTAEPVNVPWSRRQLTDLARTRAQNSAPTWLIAIGAPDRPALATMSITHTPAGIEEHITMALGYHEDQEQPTSDVLSDLAETLVTRHDLATMLTQTRTARADLTTPAHFEPIPIPLTLTLGPSAVRDLGANRLRAAQTGPPPARLGPRAHPALHYTFGDGTDPAALDQLRQIYTRFKTK